MEGGLKLPNAMLGKYNVMYLVSIIFAAALYGEFAKLHLAIQGQSSKLGNCYALFEELV